MSFLFPPLVNSTLKLLHNLRQRSKNAAVHATRLSLKKKSPSVDFRWAARQRRARVYRQHVFTFVTCRSSLAPVARANRTVCTRAAKERAALGLHRRRCPDSRQVQ